MLSELSIRDLVLIERLDIAFAPRLNLLTGETGAGKSILLDALGLALGQRGDAGLVRPGADKAVVRACFDVATDHPANHILSAHDMPVEDMLLLRRVLGADGRSRAYLNEAACGVGLLRQVGAALAEIQGQFDRHGLMDATSHLPLLDSFAGNDEKLAELNATYRDWRARAHDLNTAREMAEQAAANGEYLAHALAELDRLAPQPGEVEELAATRNLMQNAEQLGEAITLARTHIADQGGAEEQTHLAARALQRVAGKLSGAADDALAALERAGVEIGEALAALNDLEAGLEVNEGHLEAVEERLFAIRDLARKHQVDADQLSRTREDLARRLATINDDGARIAELEQGCTAAREQYIRQAQALGETRRHAAAELERTVATELLPLKLENARFRVMLTPLAESAWGPHGIERVSFHAAFNPGMTPGPLSRVASGGELSRLLLAIKLSLAADRHPMTLVFDEVDSGIGGATAAAVGERLSRLAERQQLLVVTHSPQVAARGHEHWRVSKEQTAADTTRTRITPLDDRAREEEIARMLAGETVTGEARAAARRLLDGKGESDGKDAVSDMLHDSEKRDAGSLGLV